EFVDVDVIDASDLVQRVARLDHVGAAGLRGGRLVGQVDDGSAVLGERAPGQQGQAEYAGQPGGSRQVCGARRGKRKIGQWQLPVEHVLLLVAQDCIPALSGTKRTASSSVRFQLAVPVRSMSTSLWLEAPSGAIRRPPGASWSSSACGMARPAAATTIASNGATPGRPSMPSPWIRRTRVASRRAR